MTEKKSKKIRWYANTVQVCDKGGVAQIIFSGENSEVLGQYECKNYLDFNTLYATNDYFRTLIGDEDAFFKFKQTFELVDTEEEDDGTFYTAELLCKKLIVDDKFNCTTGYAQVQKILSILYESGITGLAKFVAKEKARMSKDAYDFDNYYSGSFETTMALCEYMSNVVIDRVIRAAKACSQLQFNLHNYNMLLAAKLISELGGYSSSFRGDITHVHVINGTPLIIQTTCDNRDQFYAVGNHSYQYNGFEECLMAIYFKQFTDAAWTLYAAANQPK